MIRLLALMLLAGLTLAQTAPQLTPAFCTQYLSAARGSSGAKYTSQCVAVLYQQQTDTAPSEAQIRALSEAYASKPQFTPPTVQRRASKKDLIAAIAATEQILRVMAKDLSDRDVAQAILNAGKKGVKVYMLVDIDQPRSYMAQLKGQPNINIRGFTNLSGVLFLMDQNRFATFSGQPSKGVQIVDNYPGVVGSTISTFDSAWGQSKAF